MKEIKIWGDEDSKDLKIKLRNYRSTVWCSDEGTDVYLFMTSQEAEEMAHQIYNKMQEMDGVVKT